MDGFLEENMDRLDQLMITPKLLELLTEIDEFKGRWEAPFLLEDAFSSPNFLKIANERQRYLMLAI